MKHSLKYIAIAALAATFFSCKKDNYDPPNIEITGRLVYQNEPIQLERNAVHLQIYQYGFGRVGPVDQTFTQDGSYSALLFKGNYQLTIPNGDGPFIRTQTKPGVPDSVSVDLTGPQTIDFEVTPYYLVKSQQYASTGRNVKFTFNAQKVITDANAKDIERIDVYANTTQFVSGSSQIASREYANSAIIDPANIQVYKFIPPQTITSDSIFVRIGIKIKDVEDMIFCPVQRIALGKIDNYARIEPNGGTLYGGAEIDSFSNDKSHTYVGNIAAVGSGIDIPVTIGTAGNYVINIGGGTDIKGTTHTVYVDGNATAVQVTSYPAQGALNFDISPVQFQLSAGNHIISIRKTATDAGQANIDWVDVFRLAQ